MTEDDDARFTVLVERHRRDLQVHCYRMLGSFDESEDAVQELFLRAWRSRSTARGAFRAWLYRIATTACLDLIAKRPASRRTATTGGAPGISEVPWLQPYPDALLDPGAPLDPGALLEHVPDPTDGPHRRGTGAPHPLDGGHRGSRPHPARAVP